jgi:predicted ATPase
MACCGASDAHAIALAFLNVLRRLTADQPLVVAVDDLPWLDPLSVSVLTSPTDRVARGPHWVGLACGSMIVTPVGELDPSATNADGASFSPIVFVIIRSGRSRPALIRSSIGG